MAGPRPNPVRVVMIIGLAAQAAACSTGVAAPPRPAGLPPLATAPAAAAPTGQPLPGPSTDPSDGVEVVPDAPAPGETISGKILLPRSRKAQVAQGDTIFIAVRRLGAEPGPGALVAAQRLQARDFPLPFTLSGRDSMIPGIPFAGKVSISVRVDKDGDPLTRRRGDVQGRIENVAVGTQGVVIALDQLQAEDLTLSGAGLLDPPGLPGGPRALPPGHPPVP